MSRSRPRISRLLLSTGIVMLGIAGVLGACSPAPQAATPVPTELPVNTPTAVVPTHEWIKIDLPTGASQIQVGSEVYRLVCRDCHGDLGQGLTGEWRATWAPEDQNCWQSKCHGYNHPSDGFYMPIAPPVVGKDVLAQYATAKDLHDYIQKTMPWYNPGVLTARDSWSATAFILQMNHIDPGSTLNDQTASQIRLR